MADRNLTKAERRAARAAGGGGKKRKRAEGGGAPKGERKKAGRRKGAAPAAEAAAPPEEASFEERLDWRLTQLEEAVAAQAKVSEELLERINAVLSESPPDAASGKAD